MSSPPMMISPPVGVSNPEIIRNIVVLPQPDGPSSANNSSWAISKETLSTALTPPGKLLVTLRMDTIVSVMISALLRFGGCLQLHGKNRGNDGDDDEHGRSGIDLRRNS